MSVSGILELQQVGSLLIATVLYMPHGLAGAFVRLGQRWGRWRLRLR